MKISAQSKYALLGIVLSQSSNEEERNYVSTTNLVVAYNLTPEVITELQQNGLIDNETKATPKGVWFSHLGLTDSPPNFQKLIKSLTLKAQLSLLMFAIGELATRHQTTKSNEIKTQVESIFDSFERYFTGHNLWQILQKGVLPKKSKSIAEIAKDYGKIKTYNKEKYEK